MLNLNCKENKDIYCHYINTNRMQGNEYKLIIIVVVHVPVNIFNCIQL